MAVSLAKKLEPERVLDRFRRIRGSGSGILAA